MFRPLAIPALFEYDLSHPRTPQYNDMCFSFFAWLSLYWGGQGGAAPVVMFSSAQRGMIFLKNEDDCLNN